MDLFMSLVGDLPDLAILLTGAVVTGLVALLVAWMSRRILFSDRDGSLESHAKLADLVHGSLLAFTVFTLALVLADVRTNLGKTLDSSLREASMITRLDVELEVLGGKEADVARQRLRGYVTAITTRDWPALEREAPSLSAEGDAWMKDLMIAVRAAARANPDSASAINAFIPQLEDLRLSRLENATKSVTNVFWWIIFAFLLGAMAMNGRHSSDMVSTALIFLHMAGIGLVLALIVVMDQPFRGETSVPATPIAEALAARPLPSN